jgi:hypothetical protein
LAQADQIASNARWSSGPAAASLFAMQHGLLPEEEFPAGVAA